MLKHLGMVAAQLDRAEPGVIGAGKKKTKKKPGGEGGLSFEKLKK